MSGLEAAGAVSAILGIVGFGLSTGQTVLDFYNSVRNRRSDINQLCESIQNVLQTLEKVKDQVRRRGVDNDASSTVLASLRACETTMKRLDGKMKKIQNKATQRGVRAAPFALQYPFREKTITKLRDFVNQDLMQGLLVAMHLLSIDTSTMTYHAVVEGTDRTGQAITSLREDIDELLELSLTMAQIERADRRAKVLQWLTPTFDVVKLHDAIRQQRDPATGQWFIKGRYYQSWRSTPSSFVWLKGLPGRGKTVLASHIIDETAAFCASRDDHHVVYFYFSFNDLDGQHVYEMLRSLAIQLLRQQSTVPEGFLDLYESHRSGTPPESELLSALLENFKILAQIYIIIDGLDECPAANGQRSQLVDLIKKLRFLGLQNLHFLATSREAPDLLAIRSVVTSQPLVLQEVNLNEDILVYIHNYILSDSELRHWPKHIKEEIEEKLAAKASGMFRWVACQFVELKKCVVISDIQQVLCSLPSTLDETYERILLQIDEPNRTHARRALLWLSFSHKSLDTRELADAVVINNTSEVPFVASGRLLNSSKPIDILSSLVAVGPETQETEDEWNPSTQFDGRVKLAHFSVQEYLTSTRIVSGPANFFALNPGNAYKELAEACIHYLLSNMPIAGTQERPGMPFFYHCASSWFIYLNKIGTEIPRSTEDLALQLLKSNVSRETWLSAFNLEPNLTGIEAALKDEAEYLQSVSVTNGAVQPPTDRDDSTSTISLRAAPLYLAALLDLHSLIDGLFDSGVHTNGDGGLYGRPLQAASSQGHSTTVRKLLSMKPDVNEYSGRFGTALIAACHYGHEEVVQLLLSSRADVNVSMEAGSGDTNPTVQSIDDIGQRDAGFLEVSNCDALSSIATSKSPNENIVVKLLQNGAIINKQRPIAQWLLSWACTTGQAKVVEALLSKMTDLEEETDFMWQTNYRLRPTTSYAHGRSPPYEAVFKKNFDVAAVLLKRWNAVDEQDDEGRTAFYWTCFFQNYDFARLLLKAGADVHHEGPHGWSPRYWATIFKDEELNGLLNSACSSHSEGNCGFCKDAVEKAREDMDIQDYSFTGF